MAKRKPPVPHPVKPPVEAVGLAERSRPWLLGAACALVVARPLFPSEGAFALGDGLPVVMLWLALAVFWLLGAIGPSRFPLRIGWLDLAVVLIVVWHTVAAVWAAKYGSARPALNALWEWIAYAVLFLLIRQLALGLRENRAIFAVMIGLSVVVAAVGLYQYFYELPATRAAYQKNPDELLREAGLAYAPGSRERDLFEKRLESVEPLSTFALTNSLAGFLAPWLVMALGIGATRLTASSGQEKENPGGSGIWSVRTLRLLSAVGCVAVPVGLCLLLTKSRSGLLAAALGLVLVAVLAAQGRVRSAVKWIAIATVPAAALLVLALLIGGLDLEVLTQAKLSLGYRLQYWQSSLGMITDHPWLGCGPGNFQDCYPKYMLPNASEEIADPHNFLMEIWATAGTPALLAIGILVAGFYAVSLRRRRIAAEPPATATGSGNEPAAGDFPWAVCLGAAAGCLLSVPLGLMSASPPGLPALMIRVMVGLPLAAGIVVLLADWIDRGPLPVVLPAIGVAVLLVNYLAAGALGFPGVTGTLWLLLALGLNAAGHGRAVLLPRWSFVGILAIALGLVAACYQTAYRPVVECRAAISRAVKADEPAQMERCYYQAASADPLATETWLQLSESALAHWQDSRDAEAFQSFEEFAEKGWSAAPNAPGPRWVSGERYWRAYEKSGDRKLLEKALAAYRQAVDRYPTNPVYEAGLAIAYREMGDARDFEEHRETALRLDAHTPHADRKLPPELRKSLERNSSGSN